MITLEQAQRIGILLGVNFNVVPVHVLKQGMDVELEHGTVNMKTNVTDDDLVLTAKIALAHLDEYPDYYKRLENMEKNAEHDWSGREKPNIFTKVEQSNVNILNHTCTKIIDEMINMFRF